MDLVGFDAFTSGETVPQETSHELGDMLGGDDDDLFGAGDPVPVQTFVDAEPSAVAKWEQEKNAEIADRDAAEQEVDNGLKEKANAARDTFYKNLQEAQEKRHAHNKEVDEQTVSGMESTVENQWEKVVSYIDFNRTDLHEKDVSRMKSLLLQMKH